MLSTIVVTPRERYSVFVDSLTSLFSTIPTTPVVVFDSGAPEMVRKGLRALKEQRDFDLHETEEVLLPPQVRNRANSLVQTKYTCFCDNDVIHSPGWLQALENNAEKYGSGAVAPLTLIGPSKDRIIHHAGSEISVKKDRRGRLLLNSVHRLSGVLYDEAVKNKFYGISVDCHEFEYHCAFVRTDVLREIGGHDERQTKHDHLNDSLRILMKGHRITFEKNAVVMYSAFAPFADYDWPFFFDRWSLQSSTDSERALDECWHARKNYQGKELSFAKMHHKRVVATTLPAWTKKIMPHRALEALVTARLKFLERQHHPVVLDAPPHIPPPPPSNGLEIAGIPGAELISEQFRQSQPAIA